MFFFFFFPKPCDGIQYLKSQDPRDNRIVDVLKTELFCARVCVCVCTYKNHICLFRITDDKKINIFLYI